MGSTGENARRKEQNKHGENNYNSKNKGKKIMLKFDNLEQLQKALELEATKQVYKEHEENERATGPPRPPPEEKKLENELKELRVERLRQQVERERRQEEARQKQHRSDNAVYVISLLFTFLSVVASIVLFLVLILKF